MMRWNDRALIPERFVVIVSKMIREVLTRREKIHRFRTNTKESLLGNWLCVHGENDR